ncbi:type II toxin-antitoxin system RelE/ParE family toxin [Ramlibacter sp. WS9]|uniref:type II toxin-antitoxin system RelE/ParE family toxin n=1 Tax=Ramlibacter sp. WS9 TaxID=1882741 RepID=UPI0011437310|nr:type II toxin-antitoxin system RelE/ParE family toxin [Ramlibacter sp. WS9]ROZ62426.1 type II toxin-antitoxin system RelE/ParE family toxin [Ramlibacter sp. WS9]
MSYFFADAARVEHLEHVAYYEEQRPGLGARYLAAFDVAMAKVCESPERYRVEHAPGIRRFRIPGFPYNILYRLAETEIEVLAVAPHRRRPGYWLGRI